MGQYEDEETGLYYNRFRYYDPNTGNYVSQDPIGLLGNNSNIYSYVFNVNNIIDIWGLWGALNWDGMGNHLIPRAVADVLNISELSEKGALSWFPNKPLAHPDLHLEMHQLLNEAGLPWRGRSFNGSIDEALSIAREAYKDIDVKGVLKFPGTDGRIVQKNLTPLEALDELEKMIKEGKIPCK